MVIETGVFRPLAVFVLAPAGEGDQDGRSSTQFVTDVSGGFVAVHAGHTDVEEHDVGVMLFGGGDGFEAVGGGPDLGAGEAEDHAEALAGILIVVGDDNAKGFDVAGVFLAGVSAHVLLRGGYGDGQADGEFGASARAGAFGADAAAV